MTEGTTARGTLSSPRRQWAVLALLLGVVVAGLGVFTWALVDRGAGDDPIDRLQSLRDPGPDPGKEREEVLGAGRTFVDRFLTFGPDMLDDNGKMPDYAAVGELMTSKFRTVFDRNVGYAEQVVAETKVGRVAEPYAVGVASLDSDSAELLVGGIVEFSAPASEGSQEQIAFEPLRFRYQVSMVKIDGEWLVDDLDDLDDALPSFAEASIPEGEVPGGTPSDAPSSNPTDEPTGSGVQPSPSDSGTTGGSE
ncbi:MULTISPECIES: hypothetical protein [Nocardioides]|uniref:Mammalian cell entry protein n=1 Tax=Nocardioides vastitatis TaxID=2568655 RepID=A0ABW0ZNB0_9ACTN|nr:hypothetical protein [Nocardioides sp.]THJ13497.1 hypothetical protein E7Z54_01710 [Nocardioides sp.]